MWRLDHPWWYRHGQPRHRLGSKSLKMPLGRNEFLAFIREMPYRRGRCRCWSRSRRA